MRWLAFTVGITSASIVSPFKASLYSFTLAFSRMHSSSIVSHDPLDQYWFNIHPGAVKAPAVEPLVVGSSLSLCSYDFSCETTSI
jgi:hypothetical protein